MGLSPEALSNFLNEFGELREDGCYNKFSGRRIAACMPMHTFGFPVHLDELIKVCNLWKIHVVEDAAESLGSEYKGKPTGSFGEFGVFSFNGNKIITTSSGGALISQNKKYVEKAKFLSTQARDDFPHYEHSEIGYNYRMSNVCAAIGVGQIEVLENRVEKRRYIYNYYRKNLSSIPFISFVDNIDGYYSNRWLTTILISNKSVINREDIRLELLKNNIESRPLWKPMHIQPIFNTCDAYINGVSEDLFKRGLCLPSGSSMNENDLMRVVQIIKKLYEN